MTRHMHRRVSLQLLAVVAAIASAAPATRAQSPTAPVAVAFRAGSDTIRGRFFPAAAAIPLATMTLIPGFGGDTTDVLELGARLSARGINVLLVNNRGVQNSGGTLTYANAIDAAGAAVDWLRAPPTRARFRIDSTRLVLGGHSFGGANTLAARSRAETAKLDKQTG